MVRKYCSNQLDGMNIEYIRNIEMRFFSSNKLRVETVTIIEL